MAGEEEGGAGAAGEQQASRHRLHHYLPDDLIRNILLGLPPKSLLRFRAVCKAWGRLCSDDALLRDHHLRQPTQPLLLVHRTAGDDVESRLLAFLHYCLEAVDLRRRIGGGETLPLRTVVRFEDTEYVDQGGRGVFNALEVRGSCDGLLLLSRLGSFFVCNPATRQWRSLPELPERVTIAGFYKHSGEYRVLYLHGGLGKRRPFVLTVGSHQQPRSIERRSSSAASVSDALTVSGTGPAVLHRGSMYWPPHWVHLHDDEILVFDTEAEEFRWMGSPMTSDSNFLFETEGRLALSCYGYGRHERRVYLWIKQDHEKDLWAQEYWIKLPAIQVSGVVKDIPKAVTVVSKEGDMLVEFLDMVLHCDRRGNVLRTYRPGGPFISFTRHMLRESLVQHAFLQARQDGGDDEPPFFNGL